MGQAARKLDWTEIEMYYDDGRRITNPSILRSMAEGQEIVEAWEKRMDSYHLDEIFKDRKEEDEELDGEEESDEEND